jgi:hypothetical protein
VGKLSRSHPIGSSELDQSFSDAKTAGDAHQETSSTTDEQHALVGGTQSRPSKDEKVLKR